MADHRAPITRNARDALLVGYVIGPSIVAFAFPPFVQLLAAVWAATALWWTKDALEDDE